MSSKNKYDNSGLYARKTEAILFLLSFQNCNWIVNLHIVFSGENKPFITEMLRVMWRKSTFRVNLIWYK
jgi:hypothetical protein